MRYAPALHVTRSGALPAGSGAYDWMIHRRALPIVFLTCPLLGLSEPDELAVDVEVDGGAAAVLTTQGPSSLLRTRDVVPMHHRFRLGPGAHVTYLPWLTIPFPGSRALVAHDVELAPGASFAAWDTTAVGRVARGERFAFDALETRWRLHRGGEVLLDDRLRMRGADPALGAAAFGRRSHVASVIVAGPDEDVLPVDLVRGMVADLGLAGVSRPVEDVLVVRALDDGAERLERALWPVIALAHAAAGAPAFSPGDVARRWFGGGARATAPAGVVRSAQPVRG